MVKNLLYNSTNNWVNYSVSRSVHKWLFIGVILFIALWAGCINPAVVDETGPVSSGSGYDLTLQVDVPGAEAAGMGSYNTEMHIYEVRAEVYQDGVKQRLFALNQMSGAYYQGAASGFADGTYLVKVQALNSYKEVVYSGQKIINVGSEGYAFKIPMLGATGGVKCDVTLPFGGAIDTLTARAERDHFRSYTFTASIDMNSGSGSIYLLNLNQGDWKVTIEGSKGNDIYFSKIVEAVSVTTNTIGTRAVTLTQDRATPPVVSPGKFYSYPQEITLTSFTPGGEIYYTTDENDPDISGIKYTGPFTLSSKKVLMCYTVKPGLGDSPVNVVSLKASVPDITINTPGGAFNYGTYVTLGFDQNLTGAEIRYTLDGKDPTYNTGNLYSGPVFLGRTVRLKARGFLTDYKDSNLVDHNFTITGSALFKEIEYPRNTLLNSRYYHASTVYNKNLYLLGTYNFLDRNTLSYARLFDDGTVGSPQPGYCPVRTYYHTAEGYNNRLYFIGGYGANAQIWSAPILSGGSPGGWTHISTLPASDWYYHGSVVYNGYLYIVGGYVAAQGSLMVKSSTRTVYAKIDDNGSLGAWNEGTPLLKDINRHQVVEYNGYIYAIGGTDTDNTDYKGVQYAKIDLNGSIGAWNYTSSLPGKIRSFGAEAYNGHMYIWGGVMEGGKSDAIMYAKIEDNGTLGAWKQADQTMPQAQYGVSSDIFAGHGFVSGGYNQPKWLVKLPFLTVQCDPPEILSAGGVYASDQNITIRASHPGDVVRYTLDGTVPGEDNGTVYSGPVGISGQKVLTAVSFRDGAAASKPVMISVTTGE